MIYRTYKGHDRPLELKKILETYHVVYSIIGADPCVTVYSHNSAGMMDDRGIIIVSNIEDKDWNAIFMSKREFHSKLVSLTIEETP